MIDWPLCDELYGRASVTEVLFKKHKIVHDSYAARREGVGASGTQLETIGTCSKSTNTVIWTNLTALIICGNRMESV